MAIRIPTAADRAALVELVNAAAQFTPDEVSCAVELIDASLAEPSGDYRLLMAELDGGTVGYICYGPTPMTTGTWDLYWIATRPNLRGQGIASALVVRMEAAVQAEAGLRVRVETSHLGEYRAAHRFYERNSYHEIARLRDFYKIGDDLVILFKHL